jgi:hypothetical protein
MLRAPAQNKKTTTKKKRRMGKTVCPLLDAVLAASETANRCLAAAMMNHTDYAPF